MLQYLVEGTAGSHSITGLHLLAQVRNDFLKRRIFVLLPPNEGVDLCGRDTHYAASLILNVRAFLSKSIPFLMASDTSNPLMAGVRSLIWSITSLNASAPSSEENHARASSISA